MCCKDYLFCSSKRLLKQLNWKQEPDLLFHLFTPFFVLSVLPCIYKPATQAQVTVWHVLGLDVCAGKDPPPHLGVAKQIVVPVGRGIAQFPGHALLNHPFAIRTLVQKQLELMGRFCIALLSQW